MKFQEEYAILELPFTSKPGTNPFKWKWVSHTNKSNSVYLKDFELAFEKESKSEMADWNCTQLWVEKYFLTNQIACVGHLTVHVWTCKQTRMASTCQDLQPSSFESDSTLWKYFHLHTLQRQQEDDIPGKQSPHLHTLKIQQQDDIPGKKSPTFIPWKDNKMISQGNNPSHLHTLKRQQQDDIPGKYSLPPSYPEKTYTCIIQQDDIPGKYNLPPSYHEKACIIQQPDIPRKYSLPPSNPEKTCRIQHDTQGKYSHCCTLNKRFTNQEVDIRGKYYPPPPPNPEK